MHKLPLQPIVSLSAGIILLFLSHITLGQPQDYSKVSELRSFKEEFSRESRQIQTITSDFIQEKQLIALTEKIVSRGKFWFKRSDKVRIDYNEPYTYRLIMDGDKILIKDDQKENRINVKSNKLFQQVNRIMMDCIQGTIMDSKDFNPAVYENQHFYLLILTPNGKGIRDFFDSIHLRVSKQTYAVESIEMNEPGGDKTIMQFNNKVLNRPVNDEVFTL